MDFDQAFPLVLFAIGAGEIGLAWLNWPSQRSIAIWQLLVGMLLICYGLAYYLLTESEIVFR